MKTARISKTLVAAVAAALAAVAFATVAVAAGKDVDHPNVLPTRLSGTPELSSVYWDSSANAFLQFQFDRGQVVSLGTNSITIRQGMNGHVWRTQTYTIPSTAVIRLNLATLPTASANMVDTWKKVPFTRLKPSFNVRIVQTGPVGGPLQIVRVDATRSGSAVPLPTAAG
jgi:hypothetical protein